MTKLSKKQKFIRHLQQLANHYDYELTDATLRKQGDVVADMVSVNLNEGDYRSCQYWSSSEWNKVQIKE